MSYSEARIQALEMEVFNLRQENQRLRNELDGFKRKDIIDQLKNELDEKIKDRLL